MLRIVFAAALLMAATQASAEPQARESVDAPERAGDKEDRIVCKKFNKIGSLVASYKTCKTVREWRRERENIRSNTNIGACGGTAEGAPCAL
ncbi:hypothetical protein SAMN06295912_11320 [Sphingomonas laterariae]|uniref:Uncharacterized protein n=1 Tax=Edaphosphingomonas laterariae TaxID=861865 RepID=A0A239GMN2_9SPHN|nr:hypothetical protein [Sphingomonas laterariae]SNS70427.1 hypothetical protein SAMN06295912_11320 [Sphingomonas laterariae]